MRANSTPSHDFRLTQAHWSRHISLTVSLARQPSSFSANSVAAHTWRAEEWGEGSTVCSRVRHAAGLGATSGQWEEDGRHRQSSSCQACSIISSAELPGRPAPPPHRLGVARPPVCEVGVDLEARRLLKRVHHLQHRGACRAAAGRCSLAHVVWEHQQGGTLMKRCTLSSTVAPVERRACLPRFRQAQLPACPHTVTFFQPMRGGASATCATHRCLCPGCRARSAAPATPAPSSQPPRGPRLRCKCGRRFKIQVKEATPARHSKPPCGHKAGTVDGKLCVACACKTHLGGATGRGAGRQVCTQAVRRAGKHTAPTHPPCPTDSLHAHPPRSMTWM